MSEGKRTRRTLKPPSYRLHKSSGHARVTINGEEVYLGKFGSEESRQKYAKLIAELSVGAVIEHGERVTVADNISVAELVLAYLKHCRTYYLKDGRLTDEFACIKSAVRDLVELYGNTLVNPVLGPNGQVVKGKEGFGPVALKAVRQRMIEPREKKIGRTGKTMQIQWARRFINMSIGRIRRMFKWGVENELVSPEVLMKLQAVAPLMESRSEAREHSPRHPVSEESIERVKKLVPERTRDLIDLWLLTGARPGELVKLTGEMIDRETYKADGVWTAEISDHKMAYKKTRRILVFGPKAQLILTRYLNADPSKRLFPINRATPSASIKAACRKLGIPVWTPHWLRHTAGTRIRHEFDLDATQATLGHAHANTTEIYSGVQLRKAIEVARDAG